jgi:hypothetical protein
MDHSTWLRRQKASVLVPRIALESAQGLTELRDVVKAGIAKAPAGGSVAAVARCCDSGEALVQKMVASGCDPDSLGLPNLTNKEIACLKPTAAAYLVNPITYRERHWTSWANPEKAFAKWMLGVDNPDIRCAISDKFVVLMVQIGLIWNKP